MRPAAWWARRAAIACAVAAAASPGGAAAAEPEPGSDEPTVPAKEASATSSGGAGQGSEQVTSREPAGAAERPAAIDVVVTGKRKTEDPFLADRSVAVVGPKTLAELQPRTTPEALWDTPGVYVQQTNHGGGSPIVRGLIGPQVLVLFDGVRLNNSVYRTGPLQYLNLVDPLSLERIEVLRGPGSVLYGSDAMGGVIQLIGREPRDARCMQSVEAHGASQLRYASAGKILGAHARAELGVSGFGALASGTLQSIGDLRGGRGVGVQPHSGYADYSALGSVAYRFGEGPLDGWHTKATYLFTRLDGAGRTDKLYDKHSLQIYDNELHLVYDRMHLEIEPIRTTVDLTPSYQHFFERKDNHKMADDLSTRLSAVRDEVTVNTFGLDGQLETTIIPGRFVVRYGGLYYHDWVAAEREERAVGAADWMTRSDRSYPDGSGYSHYGGYILLEGAPLATHGGHRLQLRSGYRLHGMAGDAPAEGGLPEVQFSHLGHVFMGAVQYLYRDRATVALSFAQGYRAPNLQEAVMLGDTGKYFHTPNDELGPEQSHTFELLGRGRFWRFLVSGAGYVSLLDDLIKRVPTTYQGQSEIGGKDVAHNVNAEGGLLWGLEGALDIDFGLGFSARGQVSYARGTEDLPDGESQPLSRIPPFHGLAALRYGAVLPELWRGFIETYVRVAATQDRLSPEDESDARIPEGGTPGWWTWNVRAGLSGAGHYRVMLAVENLLDAEYKYHGSGVYAAGTNAKLSYEARF